MMLGTKAQRDEGTEGGAGWKPALPAPLPSVPSSLRASVLFSEAERLAWRPPQRMGVREWAESYRILRAEDGVARPGAYRSANNPAIDGLMLLSGDFEIEEVVCMAAAQVGKSEWLRNFLAWLADLEPCPVLLVLPDERQGMKIMYKNILPMFENTPRLQPLLPKSRGKGEIAKRNVFLTNGFALTLGWSGSPASLAADPKRVVINDEVDKFAERSGREADPISLAYARTRTYAGQRQILNASTPTWVTGQIYRRFSNCPVQLAYHVPCLNAACGLYQPLAFTQVRWDTVPGMAAQDLAERIEAGRLAWFECVRCGRRHDEREKRTMISRWRFGTNDGRTFGVSADGTREFPRALRVGVHLPALMTPWVEWRHIAAQFLRVKDDPEALREFVNQWLGEPYVPTIARAAPEIVEAKTKAGGPRGIVPPWAASVLVTVDTQKDHFYYVVRAWGPGMRSARIDHGIVMTFAEIRQRLLDVEWPMADGITLPTLRLGIDSGGGAGDDLSRTEEVYRFALSDAIRIVPIKGRSLPSRDGQPWRKSRINYQPRRRAGQAPLAGYDLWLLLLDTNHFKDLLASRMGAKLVTDTGEEVELWGLDNVDDPDYVRQMSSEVKRPLTVGRRSGAVEVWQPISRGAANHYFDCEAYQQGLASSMQAELIRRRVRRPGPPANNSPRPPGFMADRAPVRRKY